MASRSFGGLPPLLPALSYIALTVGAVALGSSVPRPDASAAEYFAYVADHRDKMRLTALLLVASAVPVAVWTATVYRRLRGLVGNSPGASLGVIGGTLATAAMMSTGFGTWAIARTESDAVAGALRDLVFMAGGPGFMAGVGLLLAGFSVSMLLASRSRPVAIAGLALSGVAALAQLTVLTLSAAPALPVTRFGTMGWMIAVSLTLFANRPQRAEAQAQPTTW